MKKNKLSPQAIFRAAQNPVGWLLSAERLRDAAEIIFQHEVAFEIPYFRAHDEAVQKALAIACTGTNDAGHSEIACRPPNYPPAQVLYAYAIENALKGLIVANDPTLINGDRLSVALKCHDLLELAKAAAFQVHIQEQSVLAALSQLSVWAGRYPVALRQTDYVGAKNPDELLDWGSQNVIVRAFFRRAMQELERKLPTPIVNRFGAVVVFRPFGT